MEARLTSRDIDRTRLLYGRRPVVEALRVRGSVERIMMADGLSHSAVIDEIKELCKAGAIPLRMVPRSELDRATDGGSHQGVVAVTTDFRYASFDKLLAAPDATLLFVDSVTDPHNLGSLLRSADGAGFDGVVIPARRTVGVTPAVRRVSAGASEVVPIARVPNMSGALDLARRKGLWIVGLDPEGAEDLWTSNMVEPPLGLVVGSEDKGISPGVQKHCDAFLRIPSKGKLGSLNVAVAGAIAMFEISRRRSTT
ncbi:MAG TPA: 23S rRNA (guanosine(2251)-2'-O)-methyltransferase RlmB [Actinomycetota bacterium]|nr:23S rRNA (guanosine(2251)-2'-O)-methyltransferase RlmB [Actinomycetota bacterium]